LLKPKPGKQPELEVVESIQVGGTIDNPSYFADPFAPETGRDVSGYALAGLARAAAFPDPDNMDSVMLWLVQSSEASKDATGKGVIGNDKWMQKLIFQDGGTTNRSAATAVLAVIDPKQNDGEEAGVVVCHRPCGKGYCRFQDRS
jgi:hypothetical protein